jgi:hypothetical protein
MLMAQSASADPVSLRFQPEVGVEWRITETRTRTTNQSGRPPRSQATSAARLKVVEVTDDGYIMEWTIESVTTQGVTLSAEDGYADLLIGVPMRFEASRDGSPVALRNSAAIVDKAISALGQLAPGADSRVFETVRQMFNTTDAETLARILLPQPALIGSCQNFELELGQTLEEEIMSPNLAGGAPIKAYYAVTLKDAGTAATPAHIVITERYDPEAASVAMFDMLIRLAQANGIAGPKPGEKLPPLARISTLDCHVRPETGETVRVYMDMLIEADTQRRTDIRDISVARLR